MAKKIKRIAKIQFNAGQAKPGAELASLGINMPQFCIEFNDKTKERMGDVVPVIITAYEDKSFSFVLKTTPASILIKKAAGVKKGSSLPGRENVGKISKKQITEIAEYKLVDLNANDIKAAIKVIEGTARNMGIEVEGFEHELIEAPLPSEEKAMAEAAYQAVLEEAQTTVAPADDGINLDGTEEQNKEQNEEDNQDNPEGNKE